MPFALSHSFLRELRAELSRVGGDAIGQALAVFHLCSALEAANSFAPIRAQAYPRPTVETANLTLDFADGTTLQVTCPYSPFALPALLLVVSRHGQPLYTQAVERSQVRASIVRALQLTG